MQISKMEKSLLDLNQWNDAAEHLTCSQPETRAHRAKTRLIQQPPGPGTAGKVAKGG